MFHIADSRPQREESLNPHPFIPTPTIADFEVGWSSTIFYLLPIAFVCEINMIVLLFIILIKVVITNIGRIILVINNLKFSIDGNVDLSSNYPAMVGFTLS